MVGRGEGEEIAAKSLWEFLVYFFETTLAQAPKRSARMRRFAHARSHTYPPLHTPSPPLHTHSPPPPHTHTTHMRNTSMSKTITCSEKLDLVIDPEMTTRVLIQFPLSEYKNGLFTPAGGGITRAMRRHCQTHTAKTEHDLNPTRRGPQRHVSSSVRHTRLTLTRKPPHQKLCTNETHTESDRECVREREGGREECFLHTWECFLHD